MEILRLGLLLGEKAKRCTRYVAEEELVDVRGRPHVFEARAAAPEHETVRKEAAAVVGDVQKIGLPELKHNLRFEVRASCGGERRTRPESSSRTVSLCSSISGVTYSSLVSGRGNRRRSA